MEFSDRNSRLILVGTGIGLFGFILKVVVNNINTSFSTIYLTAFPLGVGQVFSTLLFANALIILCAGVGYCYFELHNYGNYEGDEKEKYLKLADKFYLLLLKISYISLFMSFILIFFLFAILPIVLAFKIPAGIVILLIFIVTLAATIKKWGRDWWLEFLSHLKSLRKYMIQAIIIFCWLLILPISIIAGLNTNLNTQFQITFEDEIDTNINFHFSDHLPDKMPNKIIINIVTPSETNPIILNKEDFNLSLVEVKGTENNNMLLSRYIEQNSMLLIKQSNYSFEKSIELAQLNDLKEGYIEIIFHEMSGLSTEREYRIVNHFKQVGGKIEFNQEKYDIEL